MCICHRSPTSSGSQLSANPIVAGRWQPASGLFNSPNDIRASWSALMITHSTSLHLHQHTRHRGSARAKRVCLESALVRICMPRLTDLSTDPRTVGVLHDLKDSVISHLSVETPLVPFSPKMQCRDDCFCTINIPAMPDAESTFLKKRINKTILGETEAVDEMHGGMGRCRLFQIQRGGSVGSLPRSCLWIALTQTQREKNHKT